MKNFFCNSPICCCDDQLLHKCLECNNFVFFFKSSKLRIIDISSIRHSYANALSGLQQPWKDGINQQVYFVYDEVYFSSSIMQTLEAL